MALGQGFGLSLTDRKQGRSVLKPQQAVQGGQAGTPVHQAQADCAPWHLGAGLSQVLRGSLEQQS